MMTVEKIAENGRKLQPHDGVTEWSVCGKCGTLIDWASDTVTAGREREDTSCPSCGHPDTAWLYMEEMKCDVCGKTLTEDEIQINAAENEEQDGNTDWCVGCRAANGAVEADIADQAAEYEDQLSRGEISR